MMQPTDSVAYLRKWATDIRTSSGPSIDAELLDAIAAEIEQLRRRVREADTLRDHYKALEAALRPFAE